jgi:hypothetical protein
MADFDALPPGSRAARAKGCICPRSDGITVKSLPACPLHGSPDATPAPDDLKDTQVREFARPKSLKRTARPPINRASRT